MIQSKPPVTRWCNNLNLAGKRPVRIKLPHCIHSAGHKWKRSVPIFCQGYSGSSAGIISSFWGTRSLEHVRHIFTMFLTSCEIHGHQTEVIAQSQHLCTPWYPVWIFSRVCLCRDFGTTICFPWSSRLFFSSRLEPGVVCMVPMWREILTTYQRYTGAFLVRG